MVSDQIDGVIQSIPIHITHLEITDRADSTELSAKVGCQSNRNLGGGHQRCSWQAPSTGRQPRLIAIRIDGGRRCAIIEFDLLADSTIAISSQMPLILAIAVDIQCERSGRGIR